MNRQNISKKTRMIREIFHDNRKIAYEIPTEQIKINENNYQGGELFKTEDDEFINLDIQTTDFDEKEITKYIEFAEALYEKHHKHVSIYIICPKNINITVKECEILSEASFTIKLAKIDEDMCETILNMIKSKVMNGEEISEDDIFLLARLPLKCEKEKRNYYREEYFKIINKIF